MKRTIGIAILAATMGMALSSASAQSKSKATIPFNFRVGSTLMPAGLYEIRHVEANQIWLRNLDGRENAVVLSTTTTGDTAPVEKLVFNKYGERYFLKQTVSAAGKGEMTFSPSTLEKSIRAEEASRNTEERVLVATK